MIFHAIMTIHHADDDRPANDGQPEVGETLAWNDPKARDRRVVTVMFADIADSTSLIERADAEAALTLLGPVMDMMAEAVRQFGGTVAKRAGDGIMAIFGVPSVQEDHAARACHAALALQRSVASHAARVEGTPRVRVGLGSGRVLVTGIEDAAGHSVLHDAAGAIVHRASRVEATADPGAINLAEGTYHLVRQHFDCRPLGDMTLKGFSQPQPVYRLLAAKTKPEGAPASLIGREAEIAAMRGLVGRVESTRQGGLLLITGEAGMGKTRLLRELRPMLPGTAIRLTGHALSFGQRLSYWPFIEMLKPFLGLEDGANEDAIWAAMERAVDRLFPEEPEILAYLATLLGIVVREPLSERVRYLDGETLAQQVLRAGYRLFERLTHDGTVVLVIDDAHWLDGSSLALVEHLLPVAASRPLLMVVLGRSQEAAMSRLAELGATSLPDGALLPLALGPLSIADSGRLVGAVLGEDSDGLGRLRDQVLYKAEGNPFYLEEVVRALIDTRIIVLDHQGHWSARSYPGEISIPDSIQGVIMARIDRLDDRLKHVLGVAAVIGHSFLYRVLRIVLEQAEQLDERLARLKAAELIADYQSVPELAYIFRHALVQESVYESLLLERRRRLHRQIAACIEELFGTDAQEFASMLALHCARAQEWDKAFRYLLKAAEQATRMAGDDEALLHYEEALDILAHSPDTPWDRVQHANVERRLAEIHLRRGRPDSARDHIERALGCFDDSIPSGRPRLLGAVVVEFARHVLARAKPWRDPLAPEPHVEAYVRLYELAAWLFYFSDHDYLALAILRWFNKARRFGLDEHIAKSSAALGYVFDALGVHRVAHAYHRDAVAAAERSGNPPALALADDLMGLHLLYKGDWPSARQFLERSREHARCSGELHTLCSASVVRWELLCEIGEFEEVLADAEAIATLGRESAYGAATRWAAYGRGKALRRLARFDEAMASLREAIDLSASSRDHTNLSAANGEMGLCLQDLGRLDEARTVLRDGLAAATARKVRGHTLIWLLLGLARDSVPRADGNAQRACRRAVIQARRYQIGLVAALRTRGSLAWLRKRPRAAKRWWEQAEREAAKLGATFEATLTRLELDRTEGPPC